MILLATAPRPWLFSGARAAGGQDRPHARHRVPGPRHAPASGFSSLDAGRGTMPTSPGFLSGTEVWSVVPTTQPASLGRPMGGGSKVLWGRK